MIFDLTVYLLLVSHTHRKYICMQYFRTNACILFTNCYLC